MLLWIFAAGGAIVGGIALVMFMTARHLHRRLEHLNQAYWELRYEYTRLRAELARLDPGQAGPASQEQEPPAPATFIPLSSLKK